jgi:hypothetical protein
VSGLIIFALLQPPINLLGHPLDGRRWFQVIGAVVLAGLVCWRVSSRELGTHPVPWLSLAAILALAMALFAVGGGRDRAGQARRSPARAWPASPRGCVAWAANWPQGPSSRRHSACTVSYP